MKVFPRQPSWLSRAEHHQLVSSVSDSTPESAQTDYILGALDCIKEKASILYAAQLAASSSSSLVLEEEVAPGSLERVWFWFPTLSTREKRQDFVEYAPRFGLTGFVLVGK